MSHKMEEPDTIFEHIEEYGKTVAELYTLKSIAKAGQILSSMVSGLVFGLLGFILLLMLMVGLSLWVGKRMGEAYAGFFIVAGGCAFILLLIFLLRNRIIRKPVMNSIIAQLLKDQKDV